MRKPVPVAGSPSTTPLSAAPTSAPAPVTSPAAEPEEDRDLVLPKLRLQVHDLSLPGASAVLQTVYIDDVMACAARNVLKWLYPSPSTATAPGTRSVTLIVRDMDGVAYTTGSELDDDHKEIHLSARYIAGVKPHSRQGEEIAGVATHEMVHCLQHNGRGTAPGGLIEGVADWVRLRCGLGPPHWKRDPSAAGRWDAGYQHTAYFLDYLEDRFEAGTVARINEKLRLYRYDEDRFWMELVGRPVKLLWGEYVDDLRGDAGSSD
ncbi:Peptidase of plants and bacteria [Geosmithia morbida]|uniref:Peptidase of plants and bacteria n=1 Tax=Geosmithia morbida TaxID=1094350 RepID=A0A9P4Z3J0_9HYPO|nr:Peptidase of plants and bacteria [Geosmithia morbida]KAF4126583.1 Peptidase of plants and bacteria [Geosmithia morbida]